MVAIPFPPGVVDDYPPVGDMATELEHQRELTEWFIEQDPAEVVLTPRSTGRTASGATATSDSPPRPLQRVKFVYGGGTGGGRAGLVDTGDGRNRQFTYVMIGRYDAVFGIGDWFLDDKGNKWEVEELLPYNDYEVRATVRLYGKDPQYG